MPCGGGEKTGKIYPEKDPRKQFFLNCLTKKRLCGIMSVGENSDRFGSTRSLCFVRRPQLLVHMREGRASKKSPENIVKKMTLFGVKKGGPRR